MVTISFSSIVLLVFAFQLIFLSLRSDGQTDRLIRIVCNKTRAPSQCLTSILADPESLNASYLILGKIVIRLALNRAGETAIKIHEYALKIKNDRPARYSLAMGCQNRYKELLSSLLTYDGLIAARQYAGLSNLSDRTRDKVNACEAPYVNSPFKSDNVSVLVLLDALLAISKRLIASSH